MASPRTKNIIKIVIPDWSKEARAVEKTLRWPSYTKWSNDPTSIPTLTTPLPTPKVVKFYDEFKYSMPTIDPKHYDEFTNLTNDEIREKHIALRKMCIHCGEQVALRNPTGYCDHLHYPDYCRVCKRMKREEEAINQ